MTNEAIQNLIGDWAPDLEFTEEGSEFLNVFVPAEHLHSFMKKLKEDADTAFDFLFCVTGVDYKDHLQVVYHLESIKHRHILVVKAKTDGRENAVLDTVYDIWPTSEMHEREIYDLLGINFKGHPNMKRLFLDESWEGHPLRKDYVDEVNMVVK